MDLRRWTAILGDEFTICQYYWRVAYKLGICQHFSNIIALNTSSSPDKCVAQNLKFLYEMCLNILMPAKNQWSPQKM